MWFASNETTKRSNGCCFEVRFGSYIAIGISWHFAIVLVGYFALTTAYPVSLKRKTAAAGLTQSLCSPVYFVRYGASPLKASARAMACHARTHVLAVQATQSWPIKAGR